MARTAVTLGRTHEGKFVLIAGPDVSIVEQLSNWRKAKTSFVDEKLAELRFQESDGPMLIHRMRSPAQQTEHDQRRADETARAQEADKKLKAEAKKKADAERAKAKAEAGK